MNEEGASDDGREWAWQAGDQGFHFEIPRRERLQHPPPVQRRPERRNVHTNTQSEMQASWIPDLRGRTLHEVEGEVARIKMGDHFTSLKQFERCLQSLCVLTGRKMHSVETQKHYQLCVCPFGGRARRPWRHGARGHPTTDEKDEGLDEGPPPNASHNRSASQLQGHLHAENDVIGLDDGPPTNDTLSNSGPTGAKEDVQRPAFF